MSDKCTCPIAAIKDGCPVHDMRKTFRLSDIHYNDRTGHYPPVYPGQLGVITNIKDPGDDRHTFSSGAMSSGTKPPYHLVPSYAWTRIAERFKLGADKYGVDNWKKGAADRDFILDRINHGIEHLINLKEQVMAGPGETVETFDDDDAAAVILNAIFVMEWQVQRARKR